jgi:uncharacterized protein (TIGR03663 family)
MMEADITPDPMPSPESDLAHPTVDRGPLATSSLATTDASPLDRPISLEGIRLWLAAGWAATFIAALILRLMRLDTLALDVGEATRAYDAWIHFRGQPPVTGPVPNVEAFPLLLEGLAFFLFGATDVVARLVPAFAGLAIVALPLALRRWLGAPAALGLGALAAISPTLVYASRVVSPEIVVAALSLAAVVCLVRLGERAPATHPRGLAVALGVVAGAAFASGPSAITVALSLAIALAAASVAEPPGALRRGLRALVRRDTLLPALLAFIATVILCFTRFLSQPTGIAGAPETLGAWWQVLAGQSSGQSTILFLAVLFIYEPIAIVFAIAAAARRARKQSGAVALFTAWFIAALAIWSFSSGRGPEHAIHVVLPLVLLAGIGLGETFAAIDWDAVWRGQRGLLALAMLGFIVGLAAVGILLTRVGDRGGGLAAAMPPVAVLCLVVVPLAYVIWRLSAEERLIVPETAPRQPILIGLFVLAVLLGAFGLRSATLLAFYRAGLGTELLAQRTSTLGTLPSIERFLRLSRDVGIEAGSPRDVTGSHSLSIALERGVEWPYVWYFREFPDLSLVEPGGAATAGAQVAIAASDAGLAEAGYAVETWPWQTTVPAQYLQPDLGAIASALFNPSHWVDVWRFLLFRDGIPLPAPATVAVGLSAELAGRVTPATGPFDLGDHPGSGTDLGQFRDPIGVAVGADGVIAVVDSGNARVQRFAPDGAFLDVWGNDPEGVTFTRTDNGLGPTGITIAPDGVTWVADTWGHRIVALDSAGQFLQAIGAETIDTGDDPARVDEAGGRFFGPRAIATSDDAIYVADTGNERVQKFTPDGAFLDAWGGYGSAPERLIEPVGLAIGPDGNIYVADSGNARIAIFTPEGEPVAQWPVPIWPEPVPGGLPPAYQPYLAFDAAGNLYASASNAGQGFVLNRDGEIIQSITQASGERLAQPVGVAVAPGGEILFTDVGRDTVLTYVPPLPLPPASDPGVDESTPVR